jgi:hypothetical protein
MCVSCEIRIADIWLRLRRGQVYRTPDYQNSARFVIDQLLVQSIVIAPQNVQIARAAFVDTLHYLRENDHHTSNPCAVGANLDPEQDGPLCRAARGQNNGVQCISYILPILQNHGLVGIDCDRPNKTWLVTRWAE